MATDANDESETERAERAADDAATDAHRNDGSDDVADEGADEGAESEPNEAEEDGDDASTVDEKRYDPKNAGRRYLRHEFASALIYLQRGGAERSEMERNLVAWLIACHHGKVRLAIRPFPGEETPGPATTFPRALGVWNGDALPPIDLGGGVKVDATVLSTELVAVGEASWGDRMLELRDARSLGPFRLAYLESLLRAADQRASQAEAESMMHTSGEVAR